MLNFEALKAKIANKTKEFDKRERPYTFKGGDTSIVLMPGWKPEAREVFWHEFGGHYIRGNDGKVTAFYPCDNAIYNKPCPICAMLRKASAMTTDQAVLDQIKQMNANTVYLVNAIVLGENNNEPQVCQFSKTAFEQLINTISAWMTAVFDEQNPQVLSVKRSGTGFDTKYLVSVAPEKFALKPDTYSKLHNLDDYVNQRTDTLMQKTANAISATLGVTMALPAPTVAAPTPAIQAPAMAQPAAPVAPAQVVEPQIQHADLPATGTTVAGAAPWEAQSQPVAQPAPAPQAAPAANQAQITDPELMQMLEGL